MKRATSEIKYKVSYIKIKEGQVENFLWKEEEMVEQSVVFRYHISKPSKFYVSIETKERLYNFKN